MKTWLQRYWRKIALVIIGAASAIAAEHTVVAKYAPVAGEVVQAIPCTPGEVGCEAK